VENAFMPGDFPRAGTARCTGVRNCGQLLYFQMIGEDVAAWFI
jgi:hypothetical protein